MNTNSVLEASLANFTGSEHLHYNPLYRWMTYTDGVQYFAQKAGAYWFLDIVGTEFGKYMKNTSFLTIDLVVREDASAAIVVGDGNDHTLGTRSIEWTNCPQGTWQFFLVDTTLMLRSEY